MNHLTQEDIVSAYYGEPGAEEHLRACPECQAELARLATVLDRVTAPEVPEPAEGYEARVWERLRWRMRVEEKRERRTGWMKWAAVAAVTFLAFISGLLWKREAVPVSQEARTATTTATTTARTATAATAAQPAASSSTQQQRDRVLLVVVSDHFDRSERVLIELTNLSAGEGPVDIGAERAAAEDLLASNRLYRRTALSRGEETVATLLDELEPVLLQIAHAPEDMTGNELRRIQKRVEAKGLVFKLRVVRADVRTTTTPTVNQPNV
jgi:hypothetical protein